jgi:hypothetical protein
MGSRRARRLHGALNDLKAAAIDLNSAFGALGKEQAELAGYYNVLNESRRGFFRASRKPHQTHGEEASELRSPH